MKCDEQQPEQESEGRDRSDESGVQSAAIESEICEAEYAWCRCYRKLQMYIDEDQSVDSDFSRIYAAFSKIRQLMLHEDTKSST